MSDEPGAWEEGSSAEERMRRAREDVDRIVDELLARTQPSRGQSAPAGQAAGGGVAAAEWAGSHEGWGGELRRLVSEAADAIEARVGGAVDARLRAAERRLQLQAEALEAALGEEAEQARVAAERLESIRASLDDELDERGRALIEGAEAAVGRIVGEARVEIEGRVSALEDEMGDLRLQVAATSRVSAERTATVSASLEETVNRLGAELEGMRKDLSRRSIRRERKRLEEEGAARVASLNELSESKRAELAELVRRESAGLSERASAELEAGLATVLERLERERDGVREGLEEAVSGWVEDEVAAEIARRGEGLEKRLYEVGDRLTEEATGRVWTEAHAAEQRLAAAERAQAREEEVNRRIEAAKAAAEERVRAAERRLVDVLDRLLPAGSGPSEHPPRPG